MNAETEAIDSARIEPLSYQLAFDLAADVVRSVGGHVGENDVETVNKAMAETEAIEGLNLEVQLTAKPEYVFDKVTLEDLYQTAVDSRLRVKLAFNQLLILNQKEIYARQTTQKQS